MSNDRLKFRAWDGVKFYDPLYCGGKWYRSGRDLEDGISTNDPVIQWTGLYDRDGNEVFEGDVIRHPDGDTAVIEYDFQHSGFRASYSSHASGMVSLQVSERGLAVVVGNVHESPDLMERANG